MFYSGSDNKLHITCGTTLTTKRITVDRDTGRVGINEESPDSLLHLTTNSSTSYSTASSDINQTNSLLRLEPIQNGFFYSKKMSNFISENKQNYDVIIDFW